MSIKDVLKVWKLVFSNWRYLFLGILIALGFYLINVLITSYKELSQIASSLGILGTLNLFITIVLSFQQTILLHSFISLIIISILFGILISLVIYKVKVIKETSTNKIGISASIGIFLGILAPGCAACGIGLLSVLGVGAGFITLLPFEGLELSALAIIILLFVIFKISEDLLNCKSCQIKLNSS